MVADGQAKELGKLERIPKKKEKEREKKRRRRSRRETREREKERKKERKKERREGELALKRLKSAQRGVIGPVGLGKRPVVVRQSKPMVTPLSRACCIALPLFSFFKLLLSLLLLSFFLS